MEIMILQFLMIMTSLSKGQVWYLHELMAQMKNVLKSRQGQESKSFFLYLFLVIKVA